MRAQLLPYNALFRFMERIKELNTMRNRGYLRNFFLFRINLSEYKSDRKAFHSFLHNL